MGGSKGNSWISFVIILFSLLHPSASLKSDGFSYEIFNGTYVGDFRLLGDASINGDGLQLTPDSLNGAFNVTNKSGRIMYGRPFKLNHEGFVASFSTNFVISIIRNIDRNAGEGLAFLITPNLSIPEASYGQWLGLTNATTDNINDDVFNNIVAIEFDTEKQDHDPDNNHIGLNINSVRSRKTESLGKHNIMLSPDTPDRIKYSVWVDYNGTSKQMEVYMVQQGAVKPAKPLLKDTIDLQQYFMEESYFGFAGSTGDPQIELNCVLQWKLKILHQKSAPMVGFGLGVGITAATMLILFCVVVYLDKRRSRRSAEEEANNLYLGKLRWLPGMPREFKFKDLKKATSNFHESMKLGKGGFGTVYKGILHDKDQKSTTQIAVKKFSRDNIKGKDDFFAELTIIHRLRHKHLVRLVGWCYKKRKLLLVYDFMPNGSVDKHLYEAGDSEQNTLNWERRQRILAGVASSLHYLHNEYDQKVVHRDLKASNILLDSDYNARLGDFGLARALDNERNSYTEQGLIAGTMGYLAPECFHTGRATPESDVYGFGAVVLEVMCGKSPVTRIHHQEDLYALVDWVWMLHRQGRIEEAVDERLDNHYEVDEAKRLLVLGLACSHPIASERPQAHAICQIITGTMPAPSVPPFKPAFTYIWPTVAPTNSNTGSTTFSTTNSIHSNIAEGYSSCPNLGVRAPSIIIVSNTASS